MYLDERDLAMLDFERGRFNQRGTRDQAIRDQFDLTPTRYAQLLNVLIDRPEALAADPMTVKRLQRLRAKRTGHRVRVN